MDNKLTKKIVHNGILFDDLSMEVYYGFNMRCVMRDCNDSFLEKLRSFVDQCKMERELIQKESDDV